MRDYRCFLTGNKTRFKDNHLPFLFSQLISGAVRLTSLGNHIQSLNLRLFVTVRHGQMASLGSQKGEGSKQTWRELFHRQLWVVFGSRSRALFPFNSTSQREQRDCRLSQTTSRLLQRQARIVSACVGRAWHTRPGQGTTNSAIDPEGLKLASKHQHA